jgi:4-oxalocrotonate tautomerase
MPFINAKLIEGRFDADQKREIVETLTDAMISIEGENMRPVTWCVIEELRSGDSGHRGQPAHHCRREEPGRWTTGGAVTSQTRGLQPAPRVSRGGHPRNDKRECVSKETIDIASIGIWLRNPTDQDRRDTS